MRVGTALVDGSAHVVIQDDGGFRKASGLERQDLTDAIAGGWDLSAGDLAPSARLVAPLRPTKVVAIGLNYRDHIRETGLPVPTSPLVFAKFPSSVIGEGHAIRVDPELTVRVDWEVELGVVVGRRMRNVPVEQALDFVFGYTVANDVSARDVQFNDGQWVRAKSLDTFCPLGPLIVTADEIDDPGSLRMYTRVNDEVVQNSSTSEMIFSVPELLAYCSRSFTLEPGDVLLTGTPWGCGEFMSPPRSLQPGDVVEVEIEGIGTLRNPVMAPPDPQVTPSGAEPG